MRFARFLVSALCAVALVSSTCIPSLSFAETSEPVEAPSANEADQETNDKDTSTEAAADNQESSDSNNNDETSTSVHSKSSKSKSSKTSSAKKPSSGSSKEKSSGKSESKKLKKSKQSVADASKKVDAKLDSSSSSLNKMTAASDKVSNAIDSLGTAKKKHASATKKSSEVSDQINDTKNLISRAQTVLSSVEEELSHLTAVGLNEVLRGEASFDDIDSREYLLNKVAQDRRATIEDLEKRLAKLEKKLEKKNKAVEKAKASYDSAVESGNSAAYSVEKHASKMRTSDKKASDIAGGASGEGADELKSDTDETVKSHNSTRISALKKTAEWYEKVDAKDEGVSLSFGEGADFDLSEDEFVEKWGKAIDAFYDDYSGIAGYSAPLGGHGETMARKAYEHRIDPRLCAAVSIIESGGGKYCIKSCNAWGWGAADSDPYGGASAWSSWDSAIDAWHKGMANSTTGLATASSVGELGEIYCSSKIWASNIVTQMEKISALA